MLNFVKSNSTKVFLLSVAVVAIMSFSVAFLIVASETTDAAGEQCGDDLTWTYDDSSKTLTINGEGKMYDYLSELPPWAYLSDQVTYISIPSAEYIGMFAFCDMSSLVRIDMPKVTEIGMLAFGRCVQLIDIDLPSVKIIRENAFMYCTGLKQVNMPEVEHVMDEAFKNCDSLEMVIAPKLIGDSMTAFGNRLSINYVYANADGGLYITGYYVADHGKPWLYILDKMLPNNPYSDGFFRSAVEIAFDTSGVKGAPEFGTKYYDTEYRIELPKVDMGDGKIYGWSYKGLTCAGDSFPSLMIDDCYITLTLKAFSPGSDDQSTTPESEDPMQYDSTAWYLVLAIVFLPILVTAVVYRGDKH